MPALSWIQIGVGAVAAFVLSLMLHTLDVHRIDAAWQVKLDTQKIELENKCKEQQAITKGANDELQNNYDIIKRKLVASKRLHPANCIVPTTGQTVVPRDAGRPTGQNGISTDWLRDYAAGCEEIRQTALVCVGFVDTVWSTNGQ